MLFVGNGRMITRDFSCPFLEDSADVMDKNKIIEFGRTQDIRKAYKEAEYIDAKKGVIMPAFINTHEHIYSAMARGLSIDGYDPKGFFRHFRRHVVDYRQKPFGRTDLTERQGYFYRQH